MKEITKTVDVVGPIRVHTIPTKKFKTNTLVIYMKAPLEAETVTKRAILPHILQSGTTKFRSRKELRERLAYLYGANFSVDVLKKGEHHVLTFQLDIANETFLRDREPLLENALELLSDVLLHPLTEEGERFSEKIVAAEKRSLKQRIQAIYDDKIRYANSRVVAEMCKNERYGLLAYGNEEEIDSLTGEELYSYYQDALKNDEIDLYAIGDLSKEIVVPLVQTYFQLPTSTSERSDDTTVVTKEDVKEQVIFEEQPIQQGKLHIGYRTYTTFRDDDYYALQVFNGIFGGFPHSKLFLNVRERESLAYYCASRLESHKGLLIVMVGIESSNYEKTLAIIKKQMEAMRAGEFSEEEFMQTKEMLKNQLLETVDTARGTIELCHHEIISGHERPLLEWLEGIERVTAAEVVAIANKIKLDTIYFLKGEDGNAE